MKKYQLMGRKKVVSPVKRAKYPLLHLHSLPYEILLHIFGYVAENVSDLLLLALVCSKFNNLVSKNFLYHSICFHSTSQFLRFAHAHLPQKASLSLRFSSSAPSSRINYIRSVHFVNPPSDDVATSLTQIAGTYNVDCLSQGISAYQSFVSQLKCFLNEAYGLQEVKITEIAPLFEFPTDILQSFSSIKHRFRSPKPTRTLAKLVLTAQSGWNIPFKLGHILLFLGVFDQFVELKLNNFLLNEARLSAENLPKPVNVEALVLTACIYTDGRRPGQKHECTDLFAKTTSLLLQNIRHGADLSLIDFIKLNDHLRRLSIDISSSIFYTMDQSDQALKFDFSKYNSFFKLVCSGQGGYRNLKEIVLTNFDLFNSYSHQHDDKKLSCIEEEDEEVDDPWVKKAPNAFDQFLEYLSMVPYLTIIVKEAPKVMHTCKNCGFSVEEETKKISSLLPHEWAIILAPILKNPLCSVLIYDYSLRTLFSRGIE